MEQRTLEVGGKVVRLAYRDEGAGPGVLLLHGQPGAAATWRAVAERLRGRARVLAVDRPGYGETDGRARGIEENADVALALLDSLDIERAVLGGHSWGGGVALATALRAPERVAGLVLVGSIGPWSSVDPLDRVLVAPVVGPALTLGGFLAIRRLLPLPVVRRRLVRELDTLPRSSVDELVRQVRRRDWRSFVVEQRALVHEIAGLAARLPEVAAPAVVLAGALDFRPAAAGRSRARRRAAAGGLPARPQRRSRDAGRGACRRRERDPRAPAGADPRPLAAAFREQLEHLGLENFSRGSLTEKSSDVRHLRPRPGRRSGGPRGVWDVVSGSSPGKRQRRPRAAPAAQRGRPDGRGDHVRGDHGAGGLDVLQPPVLDAVLGGGDAVCLPRVRDHPSDRGQRHRRDGA